MEEIINKIKKEVLYLFPGKSEKLSGRYCTRGWIFPNHFEPMIRIAKNLCSKYGGDKEICELACLLHDTGLIYKRKNESPKGHESNSLEFARKTLEKYEIEKEKISLVLKCIESTEYENEATGVNEKIVRTSDILSQYYSIHFFAKAHFYPDWEMYLKFLEKKINKGFEKICFDEEKREAKPIRDYFKKILLEYKKYNNNQNP